MRLLSTFSDGHLAERPTRCVRSFPQRKGLMISNGLSRRWTPAITAIVAGLLLAACQAGIPTGGNGGNPGAGGSTGTPNSTPIRYFLVGAGGSMTTSGFSSVRQSVESVAQQWNSSALLGVTIYGGGACGQPTDDVPAVDNSTSGTATLNGISPSGWSTTTEGVDAATSELIDSGASLNGSRIVYILNGTSLGCNGACEEATTVTAVQNAYSKGITVSIIDVSTTGTYPQFFQELANAGVGLDPTGTKDAPYDTATSEQAIASDIAALGP